MFIYREATRLLLGLLSIATIWPAPCAMGKEQSTRKEQPIFHLDGKNEAYSPFYEKVYSKAELNQKIPANPVVQLHETLSREVGSLFSDLTRRHATQSHLDHFNLYGSQNIAQRDYEWYIATMKEMPKPKHVDGDGYRGFLRSQVEATLSDRVKSSISLFSTVSQGAPFKLKIGDWFAKLWSDEEELAAPSIPAAGLAAARGVRYGLILKEITPDLDAPKRAALSDLPHEELRYAGQAKVVYTIGPLDPANHRAPLFNVPDPVIEARAATAAPTPTVWSRVKASRWVPSPNFHGRIAPDAIGSVAQFGQQTAVPNLKLVLAQDEGFYSLTETRTAKGERLGTMHTFRTPLIGNGAYTRHYDHRWRLVQTDWLNILCHDKAPSVNLHYVHPEERFLANASYTFPGGHSVGVDYRESTVQPLNPNHGTEAYGLSYLRSF